MYESSGDKGDAHDHTKNSRVEHLVEQLRQRTTELEAANRELRRLSHYRSLFLARMSHELRTPLTSILGFSEILLDQEQLTDTQRRFCLKIQDSGRQLQASLNQLVDLSRLEAGQTELFLQEFSLRETLRDSCATVARYARKHQVELNYDIEDGISTIVSDQGKLRQVLYNFISWSVARSRSGDHVNIQAVMFEPSTLQIEINDLGPNVTDEERLFDPDSLSSPGEDATQLGIVIGRRLLEAMDGTVLLKNGDAGGLTTLIQLPARPLKG